MRMEGSLEEPSICVLRKISAPNPNPVVDMFGSVRPPRRSVPKSPENSRICVDPLVNEPEFKPELVSADSTCWGSNPFPATLKSFWQLLFFSHVLASCSARERICLPVNVGGSAGAVLCGRSEEH